MRTGDKATRNESDKTRGADDVNAAPAVGAQPPATPQDAAADTKRPWALRKADSPSWVEKVEQF